ncbi:DUF5689 domain-containing protein [Gillisia sp. M10.2A]|uniref:DUF5689 domain-containing protein n=1 Tax=Gillisia lutea TaxID=2909668 RepID=A0ABS9EIT7_9FLAO|nr:DUF5689 domain-containing protein [Gillisia lutea]MCF4102703.1 DUF5689 domain-containing protein [Gillisia lutea]
MKQQLRLVGFLIASFLITNILMAQEVFINELHYDNASSDVNEGVEIAGPAGTDLSTYSLIFYNGSNSTVYNTTSLSGSIPELQGGFGAVFFPVSGIQNGSPDAVALVNNSTEVIQFLSYEGVITAADGPAAGLTSIDILVEEGAATPSNFSLQLSGTGNVYTDFAWQPEAESTFDAINNNQDFGGEVAPVTVLINEVDADTDGTDTMDFIELYDGGVGNTSLDGKVVVLYNGSNNLSYASYDLTGYSTNSNGYFVLGQEALENEDITLNGSGIQNGADAVALYEGAAATFPNGTEVTLENLIDAFVYDTNDGDDADLLVLLNDGQSQINEDGNGDKDAHSSQRYPNGDGGLRNTLTYTQALPTPGKANTNITEPVNLVINEVDADTPGSDTEEFVELYDGGKGNTPLDGFIIVMFNGNGDASYNAYDLAGYTTNEKGYFVLGNAAVLNVDFVVGGNALQNGPDAVALYQDNISSFPNGTPVTTTNLVDAVVYGTNDPTDEELMVLLNEGQLQLDENAAGSQADHSLQRIPNGEGGVRNSAGFVAADPSPGTENGAIPDATELISILEARNAAEGTRITITGTLTVSDQFRGSAYIQDTTGAIAIFDNMVQGDDLYKVGDSLTVTGIRSAYNEQIQISPVDRVDYNGVATTPISPKEISVAELSQHPAELVTITDVSFSNEGELVFGNSNYILTDASGEAALRIDADVSELVGKAMPASCETVTGVVGKFMETYQLLPRMASDLPCAEDYEQTGADTSISRDATFDVVAWNIEWFGDESNSPAAGNANSDEIQKEKVKEILLELDADVIAVEEISDEVLFAQMVGEMEGYNFVLSDATSYPDSPGGQKLGFVYKTETVSVTSTRAMFKSVHPFYEGDGSLLTDYPESPDRFFASGRLPFMMEAQVTINGESQAVNFVALHARANGSTDSQSRYDMRKYDVEVLKDSLDTYYSNKNLIILGDYNDDVDETVADNVNTTISTFQKYVDDTENYDILTSILSEQGYRSYVLRENMIDHITVSNELSPNFISGTARVHYEFYSTEYIRTASDHFPVSVRMQMKGIELISIVGTDVSCSEAGNGSATVNVEGGIAPYTYVWSDGQDTQTASNLSGGTYSVVVTDAVENTIAAEVVISETEALQLSVSEDQTVYQGYDSNCTDLSILEVSGGSGEYTYEWSTGETTQNINVCPTETTEYTIIVTDTNGCSIEGVVIVNVEDVSCGEGRWNQKVQVCYKGKSLCVSKYAVPALLRHGGKLGSCDDSGADVVIERVVAFPNPTRGHTTVRITGSVNTQANLLVYDFRGNVVLHQRVHLKNGVTDARINLGRYRTGLYFVKVKGDNFESEVLKVLKY